MNTATATYWDVVKRALGPPDTRRVAMSVVSLTYFRMPSDSMTLR
jgi:hypothetical protein